MARFHLPAPSRHPAFWLPPVVAVALLWPLAQQADNRALFLAINGFASRAPDIFWSCATEPGDTLVALCLLLPLLRRRPDLVVAALAAGLPATLISHGLKEAFDAARPYAVLGNQVHVIGPYLTAGSFPSGHTTTAFVLCSILAAGTQRQSLALVAVLAALLVGVARIAVGAHWPLDIAGGMLCGWTSALAGLYLAARHIRPDRPALQEGIRLFLIACVLYLFFFYDSGYPLARPFIQTLCLALLVHHLLPGWSLARHEPRSH